jgi:hypothetical protein
MTTTAPTDQIDANTYLRRVVAELDAQRGPVTHPVLAAERARELPVPSEGPGQ